MERMHFQVEGMSCEHCERAVKGAVGALPGVQEVEVSLAAGTVSVLADSAQVKEAQVKAAIEEAGYDVV